MIKIYFDGSCEPKNPGGTGAYGFLIYKNENLINKGYGIVGQGPDMTNNVAEYTALKEAVIWLNDQNICDEITVFGDSALVINQMNGSWKVKSDTSKKFVPEIRSLLNGRSVGYKWIPRDLNKDADGLCRMAYLKGRKNNG